MILGRIQECNILAGLAQGQDIVHDGRRPLTRRVFGIPQLGPLDLNVVHGEGLRQGFPPGVGQDRVRDKVRALVGGFLGGEGAFELSERGALFLQLGAVEGDLHVVVGERGLRDFFLQLVDVALEFFQGVFGAGLEGGRGERVELGLHLLHLGGFALGEEDFLDAGLVAVDGIVQAGLVGFVVVFLESQLLLELLDLLLEPLDVVTITLVFCLRGFSQGFDLGPFLREGCFDQALALLVPLLHPPALLFLHREHLG